MVHNVKHQQVATTNLPTRHPARPLILPQHLVPVFEATPLHLYTSNIPISRHLSLSPATP